MKLPRQETNWRPTSEYRGSLALRPEYVLLEMYSPPTVEDAIKYVGLLGIQQVADYDGYPAVQADIIHDYASTLFPTLFDVADEPVGDTPARTVLEECIRPDGTTDWNAVDRRTIHAVSVTRVTD